MTEMQNGLPMPVEALGVNARATFIARTYNHLLGAIVLFVLIELALFTSGVAEVLAGAERCHPKCAAPIRPSRRGFSIPSSCCFGSRPFLGWRGWRHGALPTTRLRRSRDC